MTRVTQPEELHRSSSRFACANWRELRADGGCLHPQPCLLEVGLGAFFPQSSLWLCACCSLEEGSWITLRILLKSYLRLCLNSRGETFHQAQLRRSVKQHSHNQQPRLSKWQKNEEIWSPISELCTFFSLHELRK